MDQGGIYLVLCILVGMIASSWNRSGFGWFLLSLIITPLLSAIFLAIIGEYVDPYKK